MKRTLLTLLAALVLLPALADEGMWLMHRQAEIYPQMKARGLNI